MKRNVFKKMLLICSCLTIGTLTVKAENLEGFSITATAENAGKEVKPDLDLKVNIPSGRPENQTTYYTKFVNNANDNLTIDSYKDSNGCIDSNKLSEGLGENVINSVSETGGINVTDDWYLAKGYGYAFVIEQTINNENACVISTTSTPIEITKPTLPAKNKMYTVYGLSDEKVLGVYPNYPVQTMDADNSPYLGGHKIVTKIGVVNDSTIINNVINGTSGAYEALESYAKNHTAGKTFNLEVKGERMTVSFTDIGISNGSYYYVYTTTDSTETLYRDISGINLVLAENDNLVADLTKINNNSTGTTGTTTTPTKTATKNPPTGVIPMVILFTIVLASLGAGIFFVKKQKTQQE